MRAYIFSASIIAFLLLLLSCGTENKPTHNFTATANPSEGGTINPSSGEYEEGKTLEVRALPSDGWEFVHWEGDLTQSNNPMQIIIDREYTVIGVFKQPEAWDRDSETAIVDVTNPATGQIWMDRNLGASRAAISRADEESYGDLYQWGRAADGHQKFGSPITSKLSSSVQPDHGKFIYNRDFPFDWRRPRNNNLWWEAMGLTTPAQPDIEYLLKPNGKLNDKAGLPTMQPVHLTPH